MGSVLFITGTDTGVGKTLLTAMLLTYLRERGARAFALKPVCAGSRSDVRLFYRVQSKELPMDQINPYFFPKPVAPMARPARRGARIRLEDLLDRIREVQSKCDVVLVEGIGGLMVPLERNLMVQDVIGALGCPVILVASNKLGAINHTLLSAKCLDELRVPGKKIVLMNTKSGTLARTTNPKILRLLLSAVRVFQIPFLGEKPASMDALKLNAKRLKKTLALVAKMSIF